MTDYEVDMMKNIFSYLAITTSIMIAGCGAQNATSWPVQETTNSSENTEANEAVSESSAEQISEEASDTVEDTAPEAEEVTEITEEQLKEILSKDAGVNEEQIQFFTMDDYDNDGENEAFAIIGEKTDYDIYEGGVVEGPTWFVNSDGAKKLVEGDGMGFECEAQILDFNGKKYIVLQEAYATGELSFVYEVKGKEVSEAPFSAIGTAKEQDDEASFRIVDSSYDAEYDPEIDATLGHTWKSYYFFYDPKTESVKEYGGLEISKEKAAELAGRDIVDECLSADDELENIYYRGNGIINVNYSRKTEDGYISYLHRNYNVEKGCYLDDYFEESDEEQIGTYRAALCEDIAEYPAE